MKRSLFPDLEKPDWFQNGKKSIFGSGNAGLRLAGGGGRKGMVNLQRTLRAHLLDLILRSCWADPSDFTHEQKELYGAPFHIRGWDKALLAYCEHGLGSAKPRDLLALCAALRGIPCILVQGTEDHMVSPGDCRELAAMLACPCVELSCGHFVMEEAPEALLDVLTPFLATALGPSVPSPP
jgi:pimeloyl-ACP methyl ester carboxylesterase